MTQVQETLQGETGSVGLESHFNARAEGESRTLFERITRRGEAPTRVEAQTRTLEQGVPNLTQGVDAREKRGGFLSDVGIIMMFVAIAAATVMVLSSKAISYLPLLLLL